MLYLNPNIYLVLVVSIFFSIIPDVRLQAGGVACFEDVGLQVFRFQGLRAALIPRCL